MKVARRTDLSATPEQRRALRELARSPARGEADRARGILLSLERRASGEIGDVLGVKANTVRVWRMAFRSGGVEALRARPRPGRSAWKSPVALEVVEDVLGGSIVNRTIWTLPRLQRVIRERTGISISKSRLSVVMRKKGAFGVGGHGTRCADARTRKRSTGRALGSSS